MEKLRFWCQKVLPLVYDDSLSYYEVLCKITEYINKMLVDIQNLSDDVNVNNNDIEELQNQIKLINLELEKIKNGEYTDMYLTAIENYIKQNLETIISDMVKYVVFGLTQDGYFCAYIPSSWNFIKFDTIVDYTSPLYGHLILRW